MVLCAGMVILALAGCNLSSTSSNSNYESEVASALIQEHSEQDNTLSSKEWSFTIREPKKQIEITQEEITSIDKIKVSNLVAGKVYDCEFSLSQDIEDILAWYKSLELKATTFSDGEQKPNEKEGGSEQYTVYYKDGIENVFLYYSGDEYIWSLTDDVWYIIAD